MQYLIYIEEFINNIYDSLLSSNRYMTHLPISIHEVQTDLKSLNKYTYLPIPNLPNPNLPKLGKAPGMDGISNRLYKDLSDRLLQQPITLTNGPRGSYNPLHKKGSYNEPDDYRKL